MKINVYFISLLFFLTYINSYDTESRNIYDDFFKMFSRFVFKSYLKYDNTNYTETIYIELSFNFDKLDRFSSYYKLNLYWFTNETFSNYSTNYFYGIANTHIEETPQSDVIICKTYYMQQRCDDYYVDHTSSNYTKDFYDGNNFLLDYRIGGNDNILNYFQANYIYNKDTDAVSPFRSLFQMTVIKPFFALENFDQDLAFNNTFTLFYGSIDNSSNYDGYYNPKFKTERVLTYNFSDLLKSSSLIRIDFKILFIIILIIL